MVNLDEFSGNAMKLVNIIEKVVIHKGILEDDPKIWEFKIAGESMKIQAEKLVTMGAFQAQYLKTFDYPAPKIKSDEWNNILILLKREKSEVIIEVEESDKTYIAREIFDEIRKMQVDDDEKEALAGRCLLKKDGLYWIKASKIKEIIDVNKYQISANRLSPAMTQLGMKKASTDRITLDQVPDVRMWGFFPEKFNRLHDTTDQNGSN